MATSSNPVTPGMNPERLRAFLGRPILMDLATVRPDGYPHVTPVWFEYDGAKFRVSTTRQRKKARNIERQPRVGFSIAEHSLPYAAVVGYGDVAVNDDPDGALLLRLAKRYLPAEKAEPYWRELMETGGPRIMLEITPRWTLSWTGE